MSVHALPLALCVDIGGWGPQGGWLGLFGVCVAAWLYQRYYLHRLLQEWGEGVIDAEKQWDRDLWDDSNPETLYGNARRRRRRRPLPPLFPPFPSDVAKPTGPPHAPQGILLLGAHVGPRGLIRVLPI